MAYKLCKISAVIPCRVNSTRLLIKPLQLVGEYPILELLIKQLKKSKYLDDIVLAISNKPGNDIFLEFARKNKIKFVVGNESDVLGRLINAGKKSKALTVLRITSENPFIYWEGIDYLIKKHIEENFDISYYSRLPIGSNMEIIQLKTLQYCHKHGNKKQRGELSTLYIDENPNKFKINKILPPIALQKHDIRLTVDTPQDLWVARIIFDKFKSNKFPIKLKRIIEFLNENPKIKKINSEIILKYKDYR